MKHFCGCYGTNCDINRESCKRAMIGQGEVTKGYCELLEEGKNYNQTAKPYETNVFKVILK